MTTDQDHTSPAAEAALEALAAAFDSDDFVTTLTIRTSRAPRLTVISKHTRAGDDVHADRGYFWWSGGKYFAAMGDPIGAAAKVVATLHAWRSPSLAAGHRAPGRDEIVVTKSPAQCLCSSREHARLGCLAEVVVTFGELGTAWQKDALWQTSWGRSFALCGECWQCIRQVTENRRPGLIVTDTPRTPQGD